MMSEGAKIDQARIKIFSSALTGGDAITARDLYKGFFFIPAVPELSLVTNYVPRDSVGSPVPA
ncbi:MAG: hypothetical protein ACLQOO_29495 [Terriglobia bacterium]